MNYRWGRCAQGGSTSEVNVEDRQLQKAHKPTPHPKLLMALSLLWALSGLRARSLNCMTNYIMEGTNNRYTQMCDMK